MTKFCHKCGTQAIDDESVFCNKCGTQLIPNIPEKKNEVCSNCGTKILDKESVFCTRCGSPISANQPSIKQSPPKPASQKPYKSNGIITLALIFVLFCLLLSVPLPITFFFIILSAIATYQDAKEIGAGSRSATETMDSLSWRPLSWGLTVLLLWIIGHPLYLIKRREIFYLNNPEVTSISPLIGDKLYVPEVKQSKGDYIPPITDKVIQYQKSSSQKSLKRPSILLPAVLFIVAFILLLWMLSQSGALNSISSLGSSGLGSSNDIIITKDISSMGLTINDFPTGWTGSGGVSATGVQYSGSFVKPSVISPEVVDLKIQKFSTIDKAKQEYNSLMSQAPNVKIETINLGNEGFGYVNVNDIWVIFRRGNVIVKIENVKSEYAYSPSLNDAKKYAQIVNNRINQ